MNAASRNGAVFSHCTGGLWGLLYCDRLCNNLVLCLLFCLHIRSEVMKFNLQCVDFEADRCNTHFYERMQCSESVFSPHICIHCGVCVNAKQKE